MSKKCAEKIFKIEKYIGVNNSIEYPLFICPPFVCAAIFFETNVKQFSEYRRALDNLAVLYQHNAGSSFMGALVLRSQVHSEHSGYLAPIVSDEPNSLKDDVWELSSSFRYPDCKYGWFGTLFWGVNQYTRFLFDLLSSLKGTRTQKLSSYYGLNFENTGGTRLFTHNRT